MVQRRSRCSRRILGRSPKSPATTPDPAQAQVVLVRQRVTNTRPGHPRCVNQPGPGRWRDWRYACEGETRLVQRQPHRVSDDCGKCFDQPSELALHAAKPALHIAERVARFVAGLRKPAYPRADWTASVTIPG